MTLAILALAVIASQISSPAPPLFRDAVAPDQDSEGFGLVVLCDPVGFRFSVRADSDAAPLDRGYMRRTVIGADSLVQMLPGWNGQPQIRGYLVRYETCGPYTIRVSGDAYNSNVEGESGAYPSFAAIRIIRANRTVYPPDGDLVRLTECDRLLSRARPCPTGYAVRIDGAYDATRTMLDITETASSTEDGDSATRRIATRRIAVEDDLTSWIAPGN